VLPDIGRTIARRRLAARPPRARRISPWVWALLGLWLVWAGWLSDHSFYHLWQLQRASARDQQRLLRTRYELVHQARQAQNPHERQMEIETHLRDIGWSRPDELIFRIDGPDTTRTPRD
jgi:cell division protein FtsB